MRAELVWSKVEIIAPDVIISGAARQQINSVFARRKLQMTNVLVRLRAVPLEHAP